LEGIKSEVVGNFGKNVMEVFGSDFFAVEVSSLREDCSICGIVFLTHVIIAHVHILDSFFLSAELRCTDCRKNGGTHNCHRHLKGKNNTRISVY
jgi:hypothetical protein